MVTSTCRMPAYLKSPIEFVAGDRDARASLLCVTELGHSLEFVLRGARQLDFVVANLETVERYHDQALANAEIAANGQYRKRDHLARLNDEIIDHANFLVMLVDDGTADNVRGAVARCHFLHIDVHERVRLRTHLRQHGCGRKKPADDDRACGGEQLVRKLPLHLFPRTFEKRLSARVYYTKVVRQAAALFISCGLIHGRLLVCPDLSRRPVAAKSSSAMPFLEGGRSSATAGN